MRCRALGVLFVQNRLCGVGTSPATGRDAQLSAQVIHVIGAPLCCPPDLFLRDAVADTNVHAASLNTQWWHLIVNENDCQYGLYLIPRCTEDWRGPRESRFGGSADCVP